jgi:hypothetical protein
MGALPRIQQSSIDDEGTTRFESQEMIRCELMRALDAALREQPLVSCGSEPIRLREKSNPFLGLPTSTPWRIKEPVRPRAAADPSIDVDWIAPRRRRSRAPYALLALILAICAGHAVDRHARVTNAAAIRTSARSLTAHVRMLPARLTAR